MKKLLALLMALVLFACVFTGCGDKTNVSEGEIVDFAVNEEGNKVEDSSDLPDWTGKKIPLTIWYAQGTSSSKKDKKATEDVVNPEIYRVTGVKFDEESSFDNNGELMDAKISKIIASDEWPDVIVNSERAILERLIEEDMIYDLTELIPKYMPNLQKLLEQGGDNPFYKSERLDGKLYSFPVYSATSYSTPDLDPNLMARVETPVDPAGFVYVRDDILKQIYPDASTQKEIEQKFVENGSFTEDEILDVSFKSREEFFDFLYKVKDLGVKEGNREVYPIYVAEGIDNWSLLSLLSGHLWGYNTKSIGNNYFTYWDKESGQIEYMFKQPFFKDILQQWTKLVQDKVASPDSLVDSRATFEENLNNGMYAVLYGTSLPDQNVLNAAGKNFGYRKVYIDIPMNYDKYIFAKTNTSGDKFSIVKSDKIKEEDLPQILRFFDFMLSDAGLKLAWWGPRSAGLFTEENGVRKFVDKQLESEVVYDAPKDLMYKYNINNSCWPGYPMGSSRYNPKLIYDLKPQATMTEKYFSLGTVRKMEITTSSNGNLWEFPSVGVESANTFWSARQSFETAMTKIFTATNDSEFEKYYNDMIAIAERNGLTDDALTEMNEGFEILNSDYMDNLE